MKTNSPFPLLYKSIEKQITKKRFFTFILLAFFWANVSAQNAANIIVQPVSTTATVFQSFTISVRVDFTTPPASSSVDAVEVHLTFDKTKLAVTAISKPAIGVLPTEAIPLQSISTINTNGKINYAATTNSSFPNSDFDFLTITFNAIAGGGTSTPLTLLTSFPDKTDAQRLGSSILGSAQSGTVNIQTCTPPTATIAGPSASSTCNGQPVPLKLSAATGASPYTIIVNGSSYSATVGSTFATVPFPTYNIFTSGTPAVPSNNDGQSVEAGVKFRSTQAGFIKGIRFYNGSSNAGTYTGKLWNYGTSTLMASATFSGVTANGWQQVLFATPVAIAANTTYIASYYSTAGNYASTDNYFTSAATNGPLSALVNNGVSGVNGVYKYGAGMPNTAFAATNYWADVIFTSNTNTFNLTSITDNNGCVNTGALQTLNVTSVDCSTLPVTLLNLSASPNGRKVTLHWSTSTEINNRGFDVQRSIDGANWTTIGFVAGAGNSSFAKNYTYLDDNLETRRYYYRLNQIDIDGRSKYSAVVFAVIGGKGEYTLGQNYPNPFRDETTIQYTLPLSGPVSLTLYDISGRSVRVLVNATKEAGTYAVSFNTGNLTRGVYYYRMQAGDFTDVKKLTIQ